MTVEIPGKLQCNLKKIEPCCSLRQRIWYHLMLKEVDDADSKLCDFVSVGPQKCCYLIMLWVCRCDPSIIWFGLWCSTPLSTIFQLYLGGQCYWLKKPEYPEKPTDLSQVTDKLYQIKLYRVHLTALVVIGTDCTGSCKSNYHTITTSTALHL